MLNGNQRINGGRHSASQTGRQLQGRLDGLPNWYMHIVVPVIDQLQMNHTVCYSDYMNIVGAVEA
jgi:hypothetical protein